MRFATISAQGREQGAVRVGVDQWVLLSDVDQRLTGDLLLLIESEPSAADLSRLLDAARQVPMARRLDAGSVSYAPPYRRPHKIWGIGLNYREHAADLSAEYPIQPASFIKGDHTIIGHGDAIPLPAQSERVTGEAELGLVLGRTARGVTADDALSYVFGVCAILDQTAEDILAENPRYLTRSKNFPGFFSFGPEIMTLDEFTADADLGDITVETVIDGKTVRRNTISNMAHGPEDLIAFHSAIMPLFPGDIISTGTPGAGVLQPGQTVSAVVGGLLRLDNQVTSGPDLR